MSRKNRIISLLINSILVDSQHSPGASVDAQPAAFAGFLVDNDTSHKEPSFK
jgi:hypothetical protein